MSVSIEYLDACDPILITEVNLPPGPVGRVTLVRVSAHAVPATVFLYPVHCLVWRAIFVHTRVLVCWFPKCNIWTCNRVALSSLDCLHCWNRLFRCVFISFIAFQIVVISGMCVNLNSIWIISSRSIFTPKATAIFHKSDVRNNHIIQCVSPVSINIDMFWNYCGSNPLPLIPVPQPGSVAYIYIT